MGESLTCPPSALRPPGMPPRVGDNEGENHDLETSNIGTGERSKVSESSDLASRPDRNVLSFIPAASHTPGKPFLMSVDVRRVKHRSELMEITAESYGMISEDSDLFPDASNPLTTDEILAAVQIDGPQSLQTSVRALVTEFIDIFSNDVGKSPALVEPMKLSVDRKIWADSKGYG
jgi:hypothetical protein